MAVRKNPEGRRGSGLANSERDIRIMALRVRGWTYPAIAKEVGVSVPTAYKAVQDAIARNRAEANESAGELVQIELARLDQMWASLAPRDENGNWRVDRVPAALKIMERRARLLGLDAPEKLQVDATMKEWQVLDWPEDRKEEGGGE